ncbi:MAG TPA: MarR family transcriptional regulator [Micropepsaceae bacterium]|nr:MarR family transcriptional regulator [Micropepsaceae bacterium]
MAEPARSARVAQLIDLIPLATLRLTAAADRLHEAAAISAAERSSLLALAQHGPRTVPQMAAARPVSRQYMQRCIDALESRGLVAAKRNPAHARSVLYAVTAKGDALVARLRAAEAPALAHLCRGLTAGEIAAATKVLDHVCAALLPHALRGEAE